MKLFVIISAAVGLFAGIYGASKYQFEYGDYLVSVICTAVFTLVIAGFTYMMMSIDVSDEKAKSTAETILLLGALIMVGLTVVFISGNVDMPIVIERN